MSESGTYDTAIRDIVPTMTIIAAPLAISAIMIACPPLGLALSVLAAAAIGDLITANYHANYSISGVSPISD